MEKKVREHQRKLRKSDGKNVHKSRKDPGIPSMWPLKESFVQKMKSQKEREEAQKSARSTMTLKKMVEAAESKTVRFRSESESIVEAKKIAALDNSKRAFFREFRQVVDKADVILQVLDARDPLGCRVREVEQMVLEGGSGKRIILVLNKIDLVPKDVLEGWLKYLRRELPTVAFKASTQTQRSHLGQRSGGEAAGSGSDCLGADTLLQLLKNYSRSRDLKTAITVGVVGYPNVGKSSLINSLKRARVCRVGATPGVTTSNQEIHLDKHIRLLDSPGIVFADGNAAGGSDGLFLRNCLRVEAIADPVAPVEQIVVRSAPETLMTLYGLPAFRDAAEFLLLLARRQGRLLKGGLPNIEAAARAVLHDWNAGRIPFYTAPPAQARPASEATVVTAWAPEFDLEAVERMEVDTILPAHQYGSTAMDCDQQEGEDSEGNEDMGTMHIAPVTSRKGRSTDGSGYDVQLTAEEARLNPQSNRARQKALKKARKDAERQSNDMEVDEAYDFTSHF